MNRRKRVYLDACCLNRPFDDQAQDRVRLESEAVLVVVRRAGTRDLEWVGSDALDVEIAETPDVRRRSRIRLLMHFVTRTTEVDQTIVERAKELRVLGFRAMDALHVACAEAARVDVLLTTDDKLQKRAARSAESLRVRVENPVRWVEEVMGL